MRATWFQLRIMPLLKQWFHDGPRNQWEMGEMWVQDDVEEEQLEDDNDAFWEQWEQDSDGHLYPRSLDSGFDEGDWNEEGMV